MLGENLKFVFPPPSPWCLNSSSKKQSQCHEPPWNTITRLLSCRSSLINYQKNKQHLSPLKLDGFTMSPLVLFFQKYVYNRILKLRTLGKTIYHFLSLLFFSSFSTSPLEKHKPSPADKTVDKPLWCPHSLCSSSLQSFQADALGPKTNTHIMGPCWGHLNVSNVM